MPGCCRKWTKHFGTVPFLKYTSLALLLNVVTSLIVCHWTSAVWSCIYEVECTSNVESEVCMMWNHNVSFANCMYMPHQCIIQTPNLEWKIWLKALHNTYKSAVVYNLGRKVDYIWMFMVMLLDLLKRETTKQQRAYLC